MSYYDTAPPCLIPSINAYAEANGTGYETAAKEVYRACEVWVVSMGVDRSKVLYGWTAISRAMGVSIPTARKKNLPVTRVEGKMKVYITLGDLLNFMKGENNE